MGRLKRSFPRPEGAPCPGDAGWGAYLRACVEGAFCQLTMNNEQLTINNEQL